MNKWQVIDSVYWNLDKLDEKDIWRLVDLIDEYTAINMMRLWLYKSNPPGDIFVKAHGILEWYQENKFITNKQRRWLIMTMCAYWDKTSCQLYNQLFLN